MLTFKFKDLEDTGRGIDPHLFTRPGLHLTPNVNRPTLDEHYYSPVLWNYNDLLRSQTILTKICTQSCLFNAGSCVGRIRIRMFLDLLDPDLSIFVRIRNKDPSIISQKYNKNLGFYCCGSTTLNTISPSLFLTKKKDILHITQKTEV
jgi:hypothetical protein